MVREVETRFRLIDKDHVEFFTGQKPTEEMLREVEEASKRPVILDEDCPEMSERMIKAFRSAVIQRNRRNRA